MRLYLQNMIDKKLVSRLNKEQLKSTRRKEKPNVQKIKQLWHRRESSCRGINDPRTCTQAIQFSSVAQACPAFCNPMGCSIPGLPVHHQLPEFTQTQRPLSRWCHPAISFSVVPFSSCLQSFPAQAIANCKTGLLDKHKRSEDTEY